MVKFTFTISHVPGKQLVIADTLSRAPASLPTEADQDFLLEANIFVKRIVEKLPISKDRMDKIRYYQLDDEEQYQLDDKEQYQLDDKEQYQLDDKEQYQRDNEERSQLDNEERSQLNDEEQYQLDDEETVPAG